MAANLSLQVKRGVAANLPTLLAGEFYFATDTGVLYVGATPTALVSLGATQTLTNKTFTAPVLGTPASGNLANCTFPTIPLIDDLNGIHNFSTSSLTPGGAAGTYYYIAPSALKMPATYKTGIVAGTTMRWRIRMSKSAAGTGAFNIRLYYGTLGTTGDTTLATQSVGTATAALDDLELDIILVFTSTTAAYWSITVLHSAASAAGFGCTIGSQGFSGTLSSLTTTTASLIFGVGYSNTTGTAVITIPLVQAEALGVS